MIVGELKVIGTSNEHGARTHNEIAASISAARLLPNVCSLDVGVHRESVVTRRMDKHFSASLSRLGRKRKSMWCLRIATSRPC